MSTQKKNTIQPLEWQHPHLMIGVFLIIVAVAGIGVASYYIGKQSQSDELAKQHVVQSANRTQPTILGAQTNNWNGTITKIKDDAVEVAVAATETGNNATDTIIARITSQTQLMKWDLTARPAADGQTDTSKSNISKNQLAIGQQVLVQASSDINTNHEVEATNISIIVTPTSSK